MSNSRIDSKDVVELFLSELKDILESDTFVVQRDLDVLLKKKGKAANDPYTTANTLAALDFNKNDVYEQLKKLTVQEYAETIIDNRDSTWPPFLYFTGISNRAMCILRLRYALSKAVRFFVFLFILQDTTILIHCHM